MDKYEEIKNNLKDELERDPEIEEILEVLLSGISYSQVARARIVNNEILNKESLEDIEKGLLELLEISKAVEINLKEIKKLDLENKIIDHKYTIMENGIDTGKPYKMYERYKDYLEIQGNRLKYAEKYIFKHYKKGDLKTKQDVLLSYLINEFNIDLSNNDIKKAEIPLFNNFVILTMDIFGTRSSYDDKPLVLRKEENESLLKAFNIYKEIIKREKPEGIIRTPTVKTSNYIAVPVDSFFSELDLLDPNEEAHERGLITKTSQYQSYHLKRIEGQEISIFDLIVYINVCNIYKYGNDIMTINQIYQEITKDKKARVQPTMAKDIKNAMDNLAITRLSIDNPVHDIKGDLRPEDSLLNWKIIETKNKTTGEITGAYFIKEKPYYSKYMEIVKWQRDITKINIGLKQTKRIIELDFILMLELAKRNNMDIRTTKMNTDSILERIGIKQGENIKRYKDEKRRYLIHIEDLLTAHKEVKNIVSYKPYKDTKDKTIIGYSITTKSNKADVELITD